ncbi:MAG: lysine transporter LysE [Cyanobacteria bacterium 13_1_40CM_2_61_4]|nr:MAG: lysine transporter LysE [Cyanobacteria bacterium 13_1_40CM_2_61_4]
MDPSFLVRGLIIGFSIAAPVGPIGVLCIQRTLARGRIYGLLSGLGAATADGTYGLIAGFGLTFISSFLIGQQLWIRLIGGTFLLYLGLRTILSKPAQPERAQGTTAKGENLLAAYVSTLFLTLTNPLTILSFVAIFAGIGVGGANRSYTSAAVLVLGVFLGSALWWVILSSGVSILRTKLNTQVGRWVNRISGAIIITFGVLALLSLRVV